jgi:hypothetical protein
VLIDHGTHPEQAMLELVRHAAAAGLNPYTDAHPHLVNPATPDQRRLPSATT